MEPAGHYDEVFSQKSAAEHQIDGLNDRFQRMHTTESTGPVTDLYPSKSLALVPMTNSCVQRRYDNSTSTTDKTVTSDRAKGNADIDGCPKGNVSPQLLRYACKTISDSISTGIRESSKCEMSVTFEVPRIVINSPPRVSEDTDGIFTFKSAKMEVWTSHEPCPHVSDSMDDLGSCGGKFPPKRNMRKYFRPYCIISRKHYTCRSYMQRHRKYGVSQRGNGDGVDELVQLLDQMATGESKQKSRGPKTKWQYSPPPKYCMVQYKPHRKLNAVKERSKSLDDLHLGHLSLGQPTEVRSSRKCEYKYPMKVASPLFEKDETAEPDAHMGPVTAEMSNLNML